jgi:hypothetical protein
MTAAHSRRPNEGDVPVAPAAEIVEAVVAH